jgi:competence protein ComEC
MPRHNQIPTRAPALFLLIGMVLGLVLAREVTAPIGFVLCVAGLIAGLSYGLSKQSSESGSGLWLLSFMTAATLSAWAYGTLRFPTKPESAQLQLPIREAYLLFEVDRVMQVRSQFGNASGVARIIEANATSRLKLRDKVFFRIKLPEAEAFTVQHGSRIKATGVLTPISYEVEPDSFEGYLKDTGIHYRFERISALELARPPSHFDQFCHRMNLRFQEYLSLGAPDGKNLDGIYTAMLLGRKAELSDEQSDRFRMTGTMHFFAISGLHIGVIATVIAQFLILIRIPRKVSPFIGLPLLYLYVEITGASPSAVRAFLMALFFWASFAFVRQRSPLAALAASAVFVLIFQPSQLWSIGFQLSYTVVLSILLFGIPLYETASEKLAPFRYLPKANWAPSQHLYAWIQDALLLLFAISFSAWLASAPLSAAFFGYLSPGAILLNMLLVNLAAVAITTGVVSLSLALVGLGSVAGFINHAAWISIQMMDTLVIGSTQIPGMILHCNGFAEWIAYSILVAYFTLLFCLHRIRSKSSAVIWLLPPLVIIAGLLLGLAKI